jgi:hypothetical protein
MSRRLLYLLPTVLAALALQATPALAGDGDDEGDSSPSIGSATLHSTQGCVSGDRARADVTGVGIDSVAYFLDGNHLRTVSRPDGAGRYAVTFPCANLRVGAHRARAVVTYAEGVRPARQTLRFQITRSRQGTPRFAG